VHADAYQLKLSLMDRVYLSQHVPLANIIPVQTFANLADLGAQLVHIGLVIALRVGPPLISIETTVLVNALLISS